MRWFSKSPPAPLASSSFSPPSTSSIFISETGFELQSFWLQHANSIFSPTCSNLASNKTLRFAAVFLRSDSDASLLVLHSSIDIHCIATMSLNCLPSSSSIDSIWNLEQISPSEQPVEVASHELCVLCWHPLKQFMLAKTLWRASMNVKSKISLLLVLGFMLKLVFFLLNITVEMRTSFIVTFSNVVVVCSFKS